MTGTNSAKLESVECPGKYPAVQPKGPGIGNGGKWTEFTFFRKGGGGGGNGGGNQAARAPQNGAGPFINPYYFATNNMQCMLRTFFGKSLRIHPQNHADADGNGGSGGLARWIVHLDGQADGFTVAKFENTK